MSRVDVVVTVTAPDRPGVVQTLSDIALENGANWLESSLSHLCGQFAGIIRLSVEELKKPALLVALTALKNEQIIVLLPVIDNDVHSADASNSTKITPIHETVELYIEANDRPGIIEEISSALANANINVEQLETWRESASMAGYDLFVAQLAVSLPSKMPLEELENSLQGVSDDLVVSLTN